MSEQSSNPESSFESVNQHAQSGTPLSSPPGGPFNFQMQYALPNATAVLVLGILSIVTCCCYGVVGLILGIVALVLANKDRSVYLANPAFYTESSYKNLNAGRVCALIGLILAALVILFYVIMIAVFGISALSDPDAFQEAIEQMQ
ncbi:hypothetical protein D9M68_372850 [compost metagenome]